MGAVAINYGDFPQLSILLVSQLEKDREDVHLLPTGNPGEENDRYIGLVQQIRKGKDLDRNGAVIGHVIGYVTYRLNEFRYRSKNECLPVFSSIEIRDASFAVLQPPIKIHFGRDKVIQDDPTFVANADAEAISLGLSGLERSQAFLKKRLNVAYDELLKYVDSRP